MKAITRGEVKGISESQALAVLNGEKPVKDKREVLESWQVIACNPSLYSLEGGFFGRNVYELRKQGLLEI